MEKRAVFIFVGFVFFFISLLFLGSGITSAAVGSSFTNVFGILLFLCSLLFFLITTRQSFDLEEILNDTLSQRHKKNLAYYGRQLLHHYPGRKIDQSLPACGRNPVHYEVGKINLLIRHLNSLSEHDRAKVSSRYNLHELGGDIDWQNDLAVDAKTLNRFTSMKGRGDYRYIFDKETHKYLGIARHTKGGNYEWAD